jgi:hypothetical protein
MGCDKYVARRSLSCSVNRFKFHILHMNARNFSFADSVLANARLFSVPQLLDL